MPAARRLVASLSLAACVGGLLLATASGAVAAPTALRVSPVLAPAGSTVSVSGATCAGPVTLELVGLVGGSLATLATATATPAPDGTWSTTVPMPATAAHATATCDGESTVPVVLGPDPGHQHQREATMLGDDRVVFEKSGLVEGSTYRVVGHDGTELGADVVTGGVGRVVLPWSPDRSSVLALELHPWASTPPGMLPFIQQIDIPLNEHVTLSAPVAHTGQPVTVAGDRCVGGAVTVSVTGESAGWFDLPTTYLQASMAVGTAGTWSRTFPAPPEVSAVAVGCTAGDGRRYSRLFVLGALDGPSHPGAVSPTPTGAVLDADPVGPLVAYTLDGTPVPLTWLGGSRDPEHPRVVVQGRPGKVLVVEYRYFGENAEALVASSAAQVLFDIPPLPAPPPTRPPATPTPVADPAPSPPASAPGASAQPEIAATGSAPTGQVALGVGLLLLGLALQATARTRRRPG